MAVQAQLCSENLGLAMFGSRDWPMSSFLGVDDGVGFNFQEHPQQTTQQGFQFLGIESYNQGSSVNNFTRMAFSQSLAALLEKQRQEIDWILHLQSERLKATLQEEARQHLISLLQIYETKTINLMSRRDEDLAIAKNKTMELEACLRNIEMDSQTWQIKAREKEAEVAELNDRLKQVRERETESCCGSSNRGEISKIEESKKMNWCRVCNSRSACVVLLPCRHLCSCKACEAFLGFCPVCDSVKEASMEVFLA